MPTTNSKYVTTSHICCVAKNCSRIHPYPSYKSQKTSIIFTMHLMKFHTKIYIHIELQFNPDKLLKRLNQNTHNLLKTQSNRHVSSTLYDLDKSINSVYYLIIQWICNQYLQSTRKRTIRFVSLFVKKFKVLLTYILRMLVVKLCKVTLLVRFYVIFFGLTIKLILDILLELCQSFGAYFLQFLFRLGVLAVIRQTFHYVSFGRILRRSRQFNMLSVASYLQNFWDCGH
eukprot:TRINITY_DN5044_c0_g2_i3.p1 TRINITY_DN5044_c0_g2~~TRINITY_DN5044_c0_g2_i3.p1  ORF type:complete len:229 (-),score=-32.91 TRINITY_DN5044_c0_g2_i3:25-711(-)